MSTVRTNLTKLIKASPEYDGKSLRLAKAAGVSQSTVSRILSGKAEDPSAATLHALAKALGVTVEQILGEQPLFDGGRILPSSKMTLLPVVTIEEIGRRMNKKSISPLAQYMACPVPVSDSSVAVKVTNEAMSPGIKPGDFVFVDPKRTPEGMDRVVAFPPDSTTAVIRRLMLDGDQAWLVADNPSWPVRTLQLNSLKDVVGVVVGVFQAF